jgi:DNA-binding transcriptional ArsR family regulator
MRSSDDISAAGYMSARLSDEAGLALDARARLFRALGDRSRLAVLESLSEGPKCVSDLVTKTGHSQPNVSGHLAVLRELEIVKAERRGRFVYYSLASAEIRLVLDTVRQLTMRNAEMVVITHDGT